MSLLSIFLQFKPKISTNSARISLKPMQYKTIQSGLAETACFDPALAVLVPYFVQLDEATTTPCKSMQDAINKLELLFSLERSIDQALEKCSVKIPPATQNQLPNQEPWLTLLQYLDPRNNKLTRQFLRTEIEAARMTIYKYILEHSLSLLECTDPNTLRITVFAQFQNVKDGRNFLHIACLLGANEHIWHILSHAKAMGINIDAEDVYGNSAAQYALNFGSQHFNVFLNYHAELGGLKDQQGRLILPTLPSIHTEEHIQAVAAHPYGYLRFHAFIANLYSETSLLQKMDVICGLRASIKQFESNEFFASKSGPDPYDSFRKKLRKLLNDATPIIDALERDIGLVKYSSNSKPPRWIIKKENKPAATQSKEKIFCLEEFREEAKQTHLAFKQFSTNHIRDNQLDQPKSQTFASIFYALESLPEFMIYTVLGQIISSKHIQGTNYPLLGANKEKALEQCKKNQMTATVGVIRKVLVKILSEINSDDNIMLVIEDYLKPIIFAENKLALHDALEKLPKAIFIKPPEVAVLQNSRTILETIATTTSVEERKANWFGSILDRFRIFILLRKICNNLQTTITPKLKTIIHAALNTNATDECQSSLANANEFIDNSSMINAFWTELKELILKQVASVPPLERKGVFNHLIEPLDNEAHTPTLR